MIEKMAVHNRVGPVNHTHAVWMGFYPLQGRQSLSFALCRLLSRVSLLLTTSECEDRAFAGASTRKGFTLDSRKLSL